MTRGQANVIRAFSIWTVYVWVTRMWNIARDDQSFGFKAVHATLAIISVAFAVGRGSSCRGCAAASWPARPTGEPESVGAGAERRR